MVILQRLAALWGSDDYPPEKVTLQALAQVERELGFVFPDDYRAAVLSVDLPRPTIALLESVLEQDIEFSVVNNFFQPHDIIETTQSWHKIGLRKDLIAFANDCSGNLFCFPSSDSLRVAGTVWLWDHDFDEVDEVAKTFGDWVFDMCAI